MNSSDSSQGQASPPEGATKPRKPVHNLPCEINLFIRKKVPSLNILFKMNPWDRSKEKRAMQMALLDAIAMAKEEYQSQLRACSPDLSTRITPALSTCSMAYDTLVSYLKTDHKTSTSGFDKSKLLRSKRRALELRLHQSKHHEK